jgi:hypothetical protein
MTGVEQHLPVIGHQARHLHQRVLGRQVVVRLHRADRGRQQLDAADKAEVVRDDHDLAHEGRSGGVAEFHRGTSSK